MSKPVPDLPVFLIDDEEAILSSTARVLRSAGIDNIVTCQDPREVMSMLGEHGAEVVLLDLAMPHVTGEELLVLLQQQHPEIPVIIVTASGDIETAVRCMQKGAFDYMIKAVEPARFPHHSDSRATS